MITEDYVSFEIAKLLKEKGFDEYCKSAYHVGSVCSVASLGYHDNEGYGEIIDEKQNSDFGKYDNAISAPTLQMAMKWLRNIHDIVCSVGLFTDLPEMPPYWSFNILNQSTANVMYEAFDVKCETYEEAAEAAIKYCLENLI